MKPSKNLIQTPKSSRWLSLVSILGTALGALQATPLAAGSAPVLLRPGQTILAAGAPLAPGLHAIPCVTDWNGDGRKDLIVGYRTADKLALYLNEGTDAVPTFTSFTNLQTAGADICHPATSCGAPAPWVCDYDADGRRDLLVGTGSEGQVYFYRNLGSDSHPVLAAGVQLIADGSVLSVQIRATPCVHDWDDDGLPDLLCGAGDGYVYAFRNVGSRAAPVYAAGTRLQVRGGPLGNGLRSVVRVADWDGDGLKDLVYSASHFVGWSRNTGSNAQPILGPLTPLQTPAPGGTLLNIDTSYRMRLELADWDDNGVPDLLLGDSTGPLYLYQGYRCAIRAIRLQSDGRLEVTWETAPYLRYTIFEGPSPSDISLPLATTESSGDSTSWLLEMGETQRYFRIRQP